MAVFNAFARAQEFARAKLADASALSTMLPWQLENLLFAEKHLGPDYWSVGVAKNRPMVETAVQYMIDDGLIETHFAVDDLFEGADILST
jgi:4,5-dihydroxyphthalate decarboxylase